MNEKEFLTQMMSLLDLEEEPALDSAMDQFEEWDSLGLVSFLSMANKVAKVRVAPQKVRDAKTLGDLFELVKKVD